MSNFDELGPELLQLANVYANNVVFWRDEHRQVLRKFVDAIELWKEMRNDDGDETKSIGQNELVASNPREFHLTDMSAFSHTLMMSEEMFRKLLGLVKKDLQHLSDGNIHNAVLPEKQLSITLRYLATAETYKTLGKRTGLSHSYMVVTIPKVCRAIWTNLKDIYMELPSSTQQWQEIAESFEREWQSPLCMGALGKKPINFVKDSLTLLALVDAHSRYIYIDLGLSDTNVLANSSLQTILDNGESHFPPDKVIGNNELLSHFMVGPDDCGPQKYLVHETDEAFRNACEPMQALDRAFHLLTERFSILRDTLNLHKGSTVDLIVRACCVLHNFLLAHSSEDYANLESTDQPVKNEPITASYENLYEVVNDQLMEYFNEDEELC